MRTYTKKYGGSIALRDLPPAGICSKCDSLMILSCQPVEHFDRDNDYSDCVTISGVPGYYCEDGCELFFTTASVDLLVAQDVLLITVGFGIVGLACETFNEISDLKTELNMFKKRRPSRRIQ